MQLHQHALAEAKGLFFFLYESSDYIERKLSLLDAVFGLTTSFLYGVLYQFDLFGRSVTPLGHGLTD
jgi:hypothetical protein